MGRGRAGSVVGVIEAAYELELGEQAWLKHLLAAVAPEIGQGLGACALVFDLTGAPVHVRAYVQRDVPLEDGTIPEMLERFDNEAFAHAWRRSCFAPASSVAMFAESDASKKVVAGGMHDLIVLNAFDASGVGVMLGAPLPALGTVTSAEARMWMQIASHIATAFRLRSRVGTSRIGHRAMAVLSPTGRIDHAEGEAKLAPLRGALRDAVARMERARGSMRHREPEHAVELWSPLVGSRYSLVDQYEAGGRRYVIAVENELSPSLDDLAPREREVVAALARGHSTKLIAYELDMSDSTVRVLLARAAQRLNLHTRAELVAFHIAHTRADTLTDPV